MLSPIFRGPGLLLSELRAEPKFLVRPLSEGPLDWPREYTLVYELHLSDLEIARGVRRSLLLSRSGLFEVEQGFQEPLHALVADVLGLREV